MPLTSLLHSLLAGLPTLMPKEAMQALHRHREYPSQGSSWQVLEIKVRSFCGSQAQEQPLQYLAQMRMPLTQAGGWTMLSGRAHRSFWDSEYLHRDDRA